MEYSNDKMESIFSLDLRRDWKRITAFTLLIFIPNILGILNLNILGLKFHTFQLAIFIAAFTFGPLGGAISGGVGSLFTTMTMGNPYILIGNIILGFFAGLFFRYRIDIIGAVLLAFLIQIPWLVFTDYYLIGLSKIFIITILISLAISNLIWAFLTKTYHSRLSIDR